MRQLLNSGQGENLEDVHQYHPKRELECSTGLLNSLHERHESFHQLFRLLRHGNVESRQRRDSNDNLVHGVPQNLLLRPGQGRHPVRPRPAGLFVVEAEELRLGCGGDPRALCAVVQLLGQGHGDGHTAHVSAMSGAVAPFSASLRSCQSSPARV